MDNWAGIYSAPRGTKFPAFLGLLLYSLTTVGCKAPTENAPTTLLELKKKCVDAGERARAARLQAHPECRDSSDPRYSYSKELSTCLYADRCLYGGLDGAAYFFIVDSFSNSVLIQYDNCFRMIADGSIRSRCQDGGTFPGSRPDLPNSGSTAFVSKFHQLFGASTQPPLGLKEP